MRPTAQDPTLGRIDRIGRAVPLPLLAVSVVLACAAPHAAPHSPLSLGQGLAVAAVAAVWSVVFTLRLAGRGLAFRLVGYAGHTVCAALLVSANPWFGVFAWTGFLIIDGLPHVAAEVGIVATALVLAASQTGGFPGTAGSNVVLWLLVAAVEVGLVAVFASVTNRAVRQNVERGAMIAELNAANEALQAALAENAGLHAQLVAQAREAGVQDERQRLAGEIHDTLAQGFVGVVAQLEAAAQGSGDDAVAHLDRARELARTGIAEARRSVRALRPGQLESAALAQVLPDVVAQWSARSGVAASCSIDGTTALPHEVEDALLRVGQEALANVAAHAGATRVGVTLTVLSDVALLDVRDDGCGWDGAARDGGYGLRSMRARLERLGGRLQLETAPGEGTALSACVPTGGTG